MKIITMILIGFMFISCEQSNEGVAGNNGIYQKKGLDDNPVYKAALVRNQVNSSEAPAPGPATN